MHQQNSYLRNNNQPIGSNPYSTHSHQPAQNQPQFSLSLNQPQTSYSNQSQSQLSFQAQGQSSYPQNNLGSSNYVQANFSQSNQPQNYAQNNSPPNYGQNNLGQNNYSQNTSGQFSLSLNNPGQNNYPQNNFAQNNLGPQNPNQTGPKGIQPEPQNVIPTTSAEIAAFMRKRPYTQILAGDDFTFSVYPKKQASFIMTHERLLMLKGYEMIAYARQFPVNKQLPFASLADVPAPKVSYPLAQVEKAEVVEEKLIITFAGPTKVTWEFHTANKNSAIEWAEKINAAKQAAISHGAQTNYNFKYDEDVLGRSVYDSPQKPQQTGANLNLGNNSFSISANSGLNSSPNASFGLNSSPNQSNNIRIEERSNYSSNYNPTPNNYGSTYNSNFNQNNNQSLSSNQYSSTYQTGTPERNQNNFSLNAQVSSNPQNYNYQSNYNTNSNYNNSSYNGNYGSNSNYQPGPETRETKQHSFSTQGQSNYSQSSNNPSFNVNISSNMARYPLSGQSSLPQQQDPRSYEPSRHF